MNHRCKSETLYVAGVPDEPFWATTRPHGFSYSTDIGGSPVEGGNVRFAWNEQGLFVRAELEDSFLVSNDRRDEQLHFETGDVFELFVKPLNADYYWEMYATPFGNKSTLFFPRDRIGMQVENFLRDHSFHGLEVTSEINESGWIAYMYVPAEQLTIQGAAWGEGAEWTVLCGRYNYNNARLENPELSMWPAVSRTNYHLTDEYALLKLIR